MMKSSPECCSPISVNFHFVHIDTWWLATAKYAPLLALLYTDQTKIYLSEGFIFTKIKATIKVNALFFLCQLSLFWYSEMFYSISFWISLDLLVNVSTRDSGKSFKVFQETKFCWAVTRGFCPGHSVTKPATLETFNITQKKDFILKHYNCLKPG